MNIKSLFITLIAAFTVTGVSAQAVDSAQLLVNYVPKLAKSTKINRDAVITDTIHNTVTYTYEISPQKPELNFSTAKLSYSKFNPEVPERFYRNYLKLGFGYPITPLAELSVHNTRNTKYSYGLNFHHFSSWAEPIGKVQKQFAYAPTSDTRLHLFFNRYFKNYTLYSSAGYNHELANLYGYSREWGIPDFYYAKDYRDSIRNSFHHAKAELGFRSNYTTEDKRFKEDICLHYDFLRTYWKDMEHQIGLRSIFAYDSRFIKISGFQHYQLDFDVDYYLNSWNDSIMIGVEHNIPAKNIDHSFKIEMRPTMSFNIKEYFLKVGVGIPVLVANDKTRCPVYPIAELQMGLVRNILSLYVGVDGQSKYNSLRDMLYENPYVKPQLDSLRFSRTQISVYGGVKGNLVKRLNYHIAARYSFVQDMPFYVLDTLCLLKNQYDVVYVDKANVLNVSANITWEAINHLYLNLNANYWGYYFKAENLEHPWYKPSWELGFDGRYVLKNKFIFDLNAKVGLGRWALVPQTSIDENGNTYISSYEAANDLIKNENGKRLVKPVLNFGLGFEWIITPQFTAFANINNIGCQYATNYYAFNNFGINALVGITYSFGNEPLKATRKKKN
ncbi:MAG: hypothetical protein IKU03_09055 [Bacteroidales bacterium]|nr:hypothetical protein [Bacteroidales bacterium]